VIHHGDTETRSKLLHEGLTEQIIGAGIEVHRALAPGLLESAYEECLCHEFNSRGIPFRRQVPLPVLYKGVQLACGYRTDIILDDAVLLELKCLEHILPVHEAQLLSYMKMANVRVGLLLNFPVATLVRGRYCQKGDLSVSL